MLIASSVFSNVDCPFCFGQSTLEQTEGAINIRENRRGNQH
jgi:hypothetical protein